MTFFRVLTVLALLAAVGLTGAKVSALWTQQEIAAPSFIPTVPAPPAVADAVVNQPPADPVLERLNQRLADNPDDFEANLLKGLLLFQDGELSEAIAVLEDLTARAPKFQLAHLVLGDLLSARYGLVSPFAADAINGAGEHREQVAQLKNEARARLEGYLSALDQATVPAVLLTLGKSLGHALVVDKSRHRLYVFRNAGPGLPPKLIDDFYIVLGKVPGDKHREGDLKTPDGVYFVTSYLPDEKLPPLYGQGAFPVNYPNEYDRRLHKTGQGIWLHGTDKSLYSRPPLDSEGCVVLTNEEFARIATYVEVGRTPVVISEQVQWLSTREWLDRNIEIQAALETWRQSWEKADLQSYLDFYSADFWSSGYDEQSWGEYKKRVFAGKTYQKVGLADIALFEYPRSAQQPPMVVANFEQRYRSNNFNGDMRKRLYLVKEARRWKILYEGGQ